MQQYLQNKKGLVQNVFDQVYDRYDLMNDFMSLGIHRLWKKSMLNMMNPSAKLKLIKYVKPLNIISILSMPVLSFVYAVIGNGKP